MVHLVLTVFPATQEIMVPQDLRVNLVNPVFLVFLETPVPLVHQALKDLRVPMVLMHR